MELSDLLWWNVERNGTEVHFAVSIDAGYNEKDTRATGTTFQQTTESKDDGPLVFLYHLQIKLRKVKKTII